MVEAYAASLAPGPGALEAWSRAFEAEFPNRKRTVHRAFTWDNTTTSLAVDPAHIQPFLQAGHSYAIERVLATERVVPPRHPRDDIEVRPLCEEADWEQQLSLAMASREPEFEARAYEAFARRQQAAHRRGIAAGIGCWWGVFRDSRLLASAGLYWNDEGTLGRFQFVSTLESERRQGLCGNLVYRSSRWGFEELGLSRLVMLADEHYHAARIYESVGYRLIERLGRLQYHPTH